MLTSAEQMFIEIKLSENLLKKNDKFVECPICFNYILKKATTTKKITCRFCSNCNRIVTFCATCMRGWNSSSEYDCGNEGCGKDDRFLILHKARLIKIRDEEVPSIRACPKCGMLIEFSGLPYCKTMTCKCDTTFCFICLAYCDKKAEFSPCYEKGTQIEKKMESQQSCLLADVQKEVGPLQYALAIKKKDFSDRVPQRI